MPSISEIPTASQLQQQLDNINKAIDALNQDGTTVPNITVMPPMPNDPMAGGFVMALSLSLNPPISNPTTLLQLQQALVDQAAAITGQLTNMGYTDDAGTHVVKQRQQEEEQAR